MGDGITDQAVWQSPNSKTCKLLLLNLYANSIALTFARFVVQCQMLKDGLVMERVVIKYQKMVAAKNTLEIDH